MPMLAVAEAWQARHPGSQPLFLGRGEGIESELAAAHGHAFGAVDARPLYGARGLKGRAQACGAALAALPAARRILTAERIGMVIGFGGFVSAPAVVAARSLGLPVAVFEANVLPGRANRWLARWADLLLAAWPQTCDHAGWSRTRVVGLPLRRRVTDALAKPPAPRRGTRRLLVTGGTFGSAFLNQAVPELVRRMTDAGAALAVLHQSGSAEAAEVTARYRRLGIDAQVMPFIDDMGAAWAWADVVVCAAGAGAIAEAVAFGRPGLMVPNRNVADDHQRLNVRALPKDVPIHVVAEEEWRPEREARLLAALLERPAAPAGTVARAAEEFIASVAELLATRAGLSAA